jgi:hypothetical protein
VLDAIENGDQRRGRFLQRVNQILRTLHRRPSSRGALFLVRGASAGNPWLLDQSKVATSIE